jgi:hypothetical protein
MDDIYAGCLADHAAVRLGIRIILERAPDIAVVGKQWAFSAR